MLGKFASTEMEPEDAGVHHAVVVAKGDLGMAGMFFTLSMKLPPEPAPIGQFLLARPCPDTLPDRSEAWSSYARRPLYVAGMLPTLRQDSAEWHVLLLSASNGREHPGDTWLRRQPLGTSLNLTGPFGRALTFDSKQRALLVVADLSHLLTCLPAIHHMLDQGGRASLLLYTGGQSVTSILPHIPIPVEVRTETDIPPLQMALSDTLRWADTLIMALPQIPISWLAQAVRSSRFRIEPGFAQVFVDADYLCGYGACLACAVPTGDGYTRACQHGPFFPLEALTS